MNSSPNAVSLTSLSPNNAASSSSVSDLLDQSALTDIAQRLVEAAKKAGADAADAVAVRGVSQGVEIRDGRVEESERSEGDDVGLRVLVGKRHFSSTTIEEMAEVFFDWQKIRDLGFESNMNIPAIADDTVIGSVNLLEKKGHYDAERVRRALLWQPIVTLGFLLLGREGNDEATFSPDITPSSQPTMEGGQNS